MEGKSKRMRSPAYPSINLEKAIELAEKYYRQEGKHKAYPSVAIQHLGYSPNASTGMRALAALSSFGLLDTSGLKEDRQVWVSELGRRIILDRNENSVERMNAIQEAALQPPIFRQLWDLWAGSLPSDRSITTTLLRDMNFNENAVATFIGVLKDTFEFARLSERGMLSEGLVDEDEGDSDSGNEDSPNFTRRQIVYSQEAERRELIIPLPTGDQAVLTYPFPMDEETFEYLGQFFNMAKRGMTLSAKTSKDAARPPSNENDRSEAIEPEA